VKGQAPSPQGAQDAPLLPECRHTSVSVSRCDRKPCQLCGERSKKASRERRLPFRLSCRHGQGVAAQAGVGISKSLAREGQKPHLTTNSLPQRAQIPWIPGSPLGTRQSTLCQQQPTRGVAQKGHGGAHAQDGVANNAEQKNSRCSLRHWGQMSCHTAADTSSVVRGSGAGRLLLRCPPGLELPHNGLCKSRALPPGSAQPCTLRREHRHQCATDQPLAFGDPVGRLLPSKFRVAHRPLKPLLHACISVHSRKLPNCLACLTC